MIYDTIIIGSGIAGFTAAIYTVRYNLKTLVIGDSLGMITEAHKVENWPGERTIHGFDLMEKVQSHAKDLGAEVVLDKVKEIKQNKNFQIITTSNTYEAKTIILAIGTEKRKLGIPNEKDYLGRGLSYCATCDGPFFKEKIVGVIGGGDAAFMAAHILSQTSKKVYIIARGKEFNAKPGWVDDLAKLENVEYIMENSVTNLIGENNLEKIELNNHDSIELQGLFVEIGSIPSDELSKQLNIDLASDKSIIVNSDQSTNIKGVFAAGDITTNSNKFRQLITAASEGAIAANSIFLLVKGGE